MPIDFPDSPQVNDVFTIGNRSWVFNNSRWELVVIIDAGPIGPQGDTGPQGDQGVQGVQGVQGEGVSLTPVVHSQIVISENYTFPANNNGLSVGPVTVADDFEVAVPDGSVWAIV